MAWNPNIPTVTNRVQDDLNAIRENFQHLDQSRIVEMGSNSNGTYVRWENGLQVCYATQAFSQVDVSTPIGNVYSSLAQSWRFPAEFADQNVFADNNIRAATRRLWSNREFGSTTNYRFWIISGEPHTLGTVTIDFVAIGRWK